VAICAVEVSWKEEAIATGQKRQHCRQKAPRPTRHLHLGEPRLACTTGLAEENTMLHKRSPAQLLAFLSNQVQLASKRGETLEKERSHKETLLKANHITENTF
jgi:hypothetical protein